MVRRARKGEAVRTVAFFELVYEDPSGTTFVMDPVDWQTWLAEAKKLPLRQRTTQVGGRRLIGEVLTVDSDLALKLMEPRGEDSWLELLRLDRDGTTEAFDSATLGELVETSVLAFLDDNEFGLIRGSSSAPTFAAVAEWIDHMVVDGERLLDNEAEVVRAQAVLSGSQARKLRAADGVGAASIRVSTTQVDSVYEVGSLLAPTLRSLRDEYGDIVVTVTLKIPKGKDNDQARAKLKTETDRLRQLGDGAQSLTASLVTYDAESQVHLDEVNFVTQKVTTKTLVPFKDENGEPIRNESAVRAIIRAAHQLRDEL